MDLHSAAMIRPGTIRWIGTACLNAVLAVAVAQEGDLTQIKERELEQVREKISRLKTSMDRRAAERDRITADLQEAEVRISETRMRLKDLERQRQFATRKKAQLEADLERKASELAEETRQLESQVKAAYMSGEQERIKLMLNQHDPATLGRLMTYYRILSEFRGDNIETVNARIGELDELKRQAAVEEARLAELAQSRTAELIELNNAQEERQALLVSLNARIQQEGSEIDRLAEQEKDLERLIAELTSILSDYPITSEEPFSAFKGRLTWPVAGSLLYDFGQPRADGRLKWNGVVLAAKRGREIRAVYHGRVIFADWLAGMGLLVIVDHGEGYMSLYGYNETTLKIAGDWVAPGDVLATVGDSGGQPQTALYFEIRQGTQPLNPRSWVSRTPSRTE
ncbi:MAG: peptidoglycan DD-metalloendopeptidase family protein [Woeseiaceae bacterium]|nr:peptidoglycan DD-metalloendopeptidase family protein [Woeseiaceae bacterium]